MFKKFKILMKHWEIWAIIVIFLVINFVVKKFFLEINLDIDSYYYTLSTIVQSLASLVGIIFVILIFNFQNRFNQKTQLVNFIKDYTENLGLDYRKDLELFDDQRLLAYCKDLKGKMEVEEQTKSLISLGNNVFLLEKILEDKKIFLDNLIVPVTLSFSAIILGIIGLALKSLNSMEGLWNMLFMNLSLTILSVYKIIIFIKKTLLSK